MGKKTGTKQRSLVSISAEHSDGFHIFHLFVFLKCVLGGGGGGGERTSPYPPPAW